MKNIVITGVSTGIGNSLARFFVQNDYRVFGSVRRENDAERLRKSLGKQFIPLVFDVTDEEEIQRGADKVSGMLEGRVLTGLINNAGIAIAGPVMNLSIDDFRQQFEVNLFGTIAVTKAFIPLLKVHGSDGQQAGRIINIGSVSGKMGYPFMAPYCASKFAIEGFSEALRRELLIYGIDVIVVAPGPIDTPIWDKVPDPEIVNHSDFGKAVMTMYNYMQNSKKSGKIMPPDVLAGKVLRIMEKKRPKTRYTYLNNKFKEYILPMYLLPRRVLDKIIKKRFMKYGG